MKKIIQQENSITSLTIIGNDHLIPLDEEIPEWNIEKEDKDNYYEKCFKYKGNTYFLSEATIINKKAQPHLKEFDGIFTESFFSGILIKIVGEDEIDGPFVKAYRYYC